MKKMSSDLIIKRPSMDKFEVEEIDKITEESEDETSQELPTFKSVNLSHTAKNDLFFDASKGQFVKVDNFAFASHANHFEDKCLHSDDTSSSLALLDSRIFDETTTNSCMDDSRIIVEELKRNLDYCSSTNESSQPNSLDTSLDQDKGRPKIKSPKDNELKSRPKSSRRNSSLRKLSSESEKLPSKESSTSEKKFAKQVQIPGNTNGQWRKRLSLDKSAKKLGQNKSHSATNLHKISVKDYHESFQLRRMSAAT